MPWCRNLIFNYRIGLIIGTGTNACYLEDVEKVIKSLEQLEQFKYVLRKYYNNAGMRQ